MTSKSSLKQAWMTISQFCEYAGIKKSQVYEWISAEKNPLPAYKPAGGIIRINVKEADEWMRSFCTNLYR